jgi:predicted nuclease of predicted toxin-antitoxin system
MRFLLDQDVYALTERFLREQDYDVVTASELGLSRAKDIDLLKLAGEQRRIFITRDRDYGNLVFVQNAGSGVLYLRILPSEISEVHNELKKVLETYSREELAKSFVVIEKNRHRIRRIE